METFLLVFGVTGLSVGLWSLYQNNETFKDRTRLIEIIFAQVDWFEQRQCLDSVTYNKHLITRCLLQDWRKLYPETIQKLL